MRPLETCFGQSSRLLPTYNSPRSPTPLTRLPPSHSLKQTKADIYTEQIPAGAAPPYPASHHIVKKKKADSHSQRTPKERKKKNKHKRKHLEKNSR